MSDRPPTRTGADRDTAFRRRIVFAVSTVIALVALAAAAWALRTLLLMTFLAVILAVLLRSTGDLLHRGTGLSRRLSVLVVAAAIVLATVAGGALLAPILVEQGRQLIQRLPEAATALQGRIGDYPKLSELWAQIGSGLDLPSPTQAAGGVARVLGGLTASFAYIGITLVGALFLALEPDLYRRGVVRLVPVRHRPFADRLIDELDHLVLSWLGGQLVLMAFIGVLTGLGLWFVGVPNALALGVLAGLLEFIPYLGPILSAVPALILSLAAGPVVALWTLGVLVGVQQVENNVLQPLVQKSAVSIPPVLLIIVLFAMGSLFGVAGLLVATPLLAVVLLLVRRIYVERILEGSDADTGEPGASGMAGRGTSG